jgi:rhamnogalacturonan acetylesterase
MDLYDQCHIVVPEEKWRARYTPPDGSACTIKQILMDQKLQQHPGRLAKYLLLLIAGILLLVDTRAGAQDKDEARAPDSKPTLFIVGDSTVKNGTRGQMGWGDPIAKLFDTDRIRVENRARGGRSSRTFQTEGLWDRVLADAKPGDFVLIQMGHNDGGALDDPARARGSIRGIGEETREIDNPITKKKETVHTYGWYLRKYIADARAKGMTPILCSPIPHCPQKQVAAGDVERSSYVLWSGQVAEQQKVPFVHLNRIILSYYAGMEPVDIKSKYFTPADNTHTSAAGAELNALAVTEGLRALNDCGLKDYLKPAAPTESAEKPK